MLSVIGCRNRKIHGDGVSCMHITCYVGIHIVLKAGHHIDGRGTTGSKKMLFVAYWSSNKASNFSQNQTAGILCGYLELLFTDVYCILQYVPQNIFRSLSNEKFHTV